MENVVITAGKTRVEISPLGAELQSISVDGKEKLWSGDKRVWSGRAPILFPFCGGLKNDGYFYNGAHYDMPKHGFARKSVFAVDLVEKSSAVFSLTYSEETLKIYPFKFTLRVMYKLSENSLGVYYFVINDGDNKMYYNIGAHEAYAIDGNLNNYSLEFEGNSDIKRAELIDGLLSENEYDGGFKNGVLPLSYELMDEKSILPCGHVADGSVIIKNSPFKRCYLTRDGEDIIEVYFNDFDNLLLWAVPGGGFIAIEPWNGLPDLYTSDENLETKLGVSALDAGEAKTYYHSIRF